MWIKIIAGIVCVVAGFKGHSPYSPILFVEGMILINSFIFSLRVKPGLNHL